MATIQIYPNLLNDDTYIMKTKEEITKEFKVDLQNLLNKYNASMEADDLGGDDYGYYGGISIEVSIPTKYNENDNPISEYTRINLGKYFK